MSHTLHRCGRHDDLKKDFVVFCMSAKTVNAQGSGPKMRRFFDILKKYPSVNFGDVKTGSRFNSDWQTIHDGYKDQSVAHYVFSDPAVVGRILKELKEADLGVSVIVSGVFETVDGLCREAGLKMHTVEYSGGVMGRTERLPEGPVLAITTMCGHGLVSANLVKKMATQVKKGKKSLPEAAAELAKPCMCGVFNAERAERLLTELN
ncbi:MAG: hypothetical protein MUC33_11805 [Desulfobacterales bacterium]|jgi:hypothetical protein|nr:hypothetical protein [Desulfobacterales bacterium]MCU0603338.1 hypothetical protein [Desulfobacterales bacterium]